MVATNGLTEYEARLRAGTARVCVQLTDGALYVEVHRARLGGTDEKLLARALPRFDGYTWVSAVLRDNVVDGIYMRTGSEPLDPRKVRILTGSFLGRRVRFRLLDLIRRGPTLLRNLVRCRVLGREGYSARGPLTRALNTRLRARLNAFTKAGSLARTLPLELVDMIASHVQLPA